MMVPENAMDGADGDRIASSRSAENDTHAAAIIRDLPAGTAPEHVEYMRRLIESFNRTALELGQAYRSLREKFDRLNLRLEETNRSLSLSLAEQERLSDYLTSILESLSSGVIVVDVEGIITRFNRCAVEMTGIPASDAVGKTYREVMGDAHPEELTPLGTLVSGKGISQVEKTVTGASGERIAVGYSISPLVNRAGEMTGAVEIFMDLRRIKALEDEISRMDKLAALGQMAAVMAHKIRNPLGGIVGFSGLLGLELEGSERGLRMVGKITEGVDKLNRIVSSLVSYTAPLILRPRRYDLGAGFKALFDSVAAERPDEKNRPSFSLVQPDGPVEVEADLEHFESAARRIMANAIEAIEAVEDGGGIEVYVFGGESRFIPGRPVVNGLVGEMRCASRLLASRMPSGIAIVADSGVGMDDDALGNLFVPFFTTKENGIGLGLATTKKIVEAHHGELFVSSVRGEGTAVCFVLPRTSAL